MSKHYIYFHQSAELHIAFRNLPSVALLWLKYRFHSNQHHILADMNQHRLLKILSEEWRTAELLSFLDWVKYKVLIELMMADVQCLGIDLEEWSLLCFWLFKYWTSGKFLHLNLWIGTTMTYQIYTIYCIYLISHCGPYSQIQMQELSTRSVFKQPEAEQRSFLKIDPETLDISHHQFNQHFIFHSV